MRNMTMPDIINMIALTAAHEGFSPTWTKQWDGKDGIGYGVTKQRAPFLPEGKEIEREYAIKLLYEILKEDGDTALSQIEKMGIDTSKFSSRLEGMIRMLAYNVGPFFTNFSSVRKMFEQYKNAGATPQAEKELAKSLSSVGTTVGGKPNKILKNRREEELLYYLTGKTPRLEKDMTLTSYFDALKKTGVIPKDAKMEEDETQKKEEGDAGGLSIYEKEIPGGKAVAGVVVTKQPSALEKIKELFGEKPVEAFKKMWEPIKEYTRDELQERLKKYTMPIGGAGTIMSPGQERAFKFLNKLEKDSDTLKDALKAYMGLSEETKE